MNVAVETVTPEFSDTYLCFAFKWGFKFKSCVFFFFSIRKVTGKITVWSQSQPSHKKQCELSLLLHQGTSVVQFFTPDPSFFPQSLVSIHPPIYLFIHPSLQPCMHAYVHPTNMILLRADFMQVLGEVLRMQFWANLRLLFPTTHSWTCCLVLYQSCVAVHRSSAGPRKELPFLTIFFLAKWSLLIWPTCYPVGLSLSPCLVSLCALHSSSSSWRVRI